MFLRREFVLGVYICALCVFMLTCLVHSKRGSVIRLFERSNESTHKISRYPIVINPPGHSVPISGDQIQEITKLVKPHFNGDATAGRLPINILLHALRLPPKTWEQIHLTNRYGEVKRWSREEALNILLDDSRFMKDSMIGGGTLFSRSEKGVRVGTIGGFSYGASETLAHFGALGDLFGELGLSSGRKIVTADAFEGNIADILHDDAFRVTTDAELEWVISGLARYSNGSCWTNRFGERMSFDLLVSRLLAQSPGVGACCGTHVPATLVTVLHANNSRRLVSGATASRIRARLKQFSAALEFCQTSSGGWQWNWAEHMPNGIVPGRPPEYTNELVAMMVVTGHHLEWVALAPADCRPPARVLERATEFLLNQHPHYKPLVQQDWHLYSPLSHAVNALLLVSGNSSTEAVPLEGGDDTANGRKIDL